MQMQNEKTNISGRPAKVIRPIERISILATHWIGSISSLITHTVLFIGAFVMMWLGFDVDRVLLVLTTVVSLEAIYLAIFIQMTINRNVLQLQEVEKDIEEISEDIGGIQEDVEEIHENVEDIQEEVEEISVVDEIVEDGDNIKLEKIEQSLLTIVREIDELKKKSPIS